MFHPGGMEILIHPTWFAVAMFLFGIAFICRALKRRESAALFLAVGFLLTAVLSPLRN
jgi:hypothetical protein